MSSVKYNISIVYIFYFLLSRNIILGNELKSQLNNLLLPKELFSNTISLIHFQSILMISASEQDFSFNISLNSSKLNYIHYPQSYRTTLLQVNSNMHKIFSNIYSTMYRIQFDVKRLPNYIKIIFKLIRTGSLNMIEKMLPRSFNNIQHIFHDNKNLMINIIDQFNNLFNFVYEIKQLPRDLSLKFPNDFSNKTDLIVYNRFDSKDILKKICQILQQMKKQLKEILQLITEHNLLDTDDMISFISNLYIIENHAYFLYEFSSIYTNILDQYVLDPIASMGRYIVLLTDEERFETLSNLSQLFSNIMNEIEKIVFERQDKFEISIRMLREAYEKLFNEFENRSLTVKVLDIK